MIAAAVIISCGSVSVMASMKAHITVKTAENVAPTELVIAKVGEDPANSQYRTNLENGIYEVDIETDFIEAYAIDDWTQITTKGMTSRVADFLIEDGAEITLTLFDDRIEAESTGVEALAAKRMKSLKKETFEAKNEAIRKIEDEDEAIATYQRLWREEIAPWENDYYARNPMISFLLDLDYSLDMHRFNDHQLMQKLKIYHDYYTDRYPGHPAHQRIAENEKAGKQIFGGEYHDYDVRTPDGKKVRASDYMRPGYNLVILWATWCSPCRREAKEIAERIDPYLKKGLNVFALTREFNDTEALKQAIEKDNYPWPTLVDLNNEFNVFDLHGASSSAVFLIDPDRKIIFSDTGTDKVIEALDSCMN